MVNNEELFGKNIYVVNSNNVNRVTYIHMCNKKRTLGMIVPISMFVGILINVMFIITLFLEIKW